MARRLGPLDASARYAALPTGVPAVGKSAVFYAASSGATLADIATYNGTATPGASVAGSTLTVDADGLIPPWWMPDGADHVYVSVNGGTRVRVGAPAGQAPILTGITPFATSKIHAFGLVMGVVGMNGTGRIWSRDATNGNLSQTDDWGANWTNLRGLPANTSQATLGKIVSFGGYIYTVLLDSLVANTYRVYRAPDVVRTASLVWEAPVFTMPANTHANTRSCFNVGSQYLFLGTYTGLGVDDSRIYRSSDGTTWNVCYGPTAGVHHIHAVAEDPYNAGHIYAALGDNTSPAGVIRSTDHGTTWSTIIPSSPGENPWQSVQISFSPNWVWMAGDRIGLECVIFDRTDLVPYSPCANWHYNIAVPAPAALTDRYYQIGYWGACDPATESYYLVANDTSAAGNAQGIFALSHVGGRMELLESKPTGGVGEVFAGNGYMWTGERKWLPAGASWVVT